MPALVMAVVGRVRRVRERHNTYNNDSGVSQSWVKSAVKLAYYHLFALLYGAVGAFASVRKACRGCLSDSESPNRALEALRQPRLTCSLPARQIRPTGSTPHSRWLG